MDKSRAKRVEHDKENRFNSPGSYLSVSICVLGSVIGYKVYTKQSFEQRLNLSKRER